MADAEERSPTKAPLEGAAEPESQPIEPPLAYAATDARSVTVEPDPAREGDAPLLVHAPARASFACVASLLIAVSAGMVFWHTKDSAIRNTNVGSRYATVEALVNHGTFAIDDTQYIRTIDKVHVNGRFYSSKPPLLSTMAAGVYAVYRGITGYNIRKEEKKVVKVVNLVFGVGLHVLLLVHLFWLMLLVVRRQEAALACIAAVGFAYLGVGYAVELNNHTPAATFGLVAFYYAFRIRNGPRLGVAVKRTHWVLCGLAAGLIPGISLPGGALTAGLALYLFLHDRRQTLLFFLPATLPGVIAHFVLTYLSTGSLLPVYLLKGAYDYPGSYWLKPRGIDALNEPKYLYAFHLLIGHHGLFSMTPAFVFSSIALVNALRRRTDLFREAVLVTGVTAVITLFLIFRTNNYGGNCVGFRWAIPYMPLLFVFFAVYLDRVRIRWWLWGLVLLTLLVGQFHVHDAFWTPWHTSKWHAWFAKNILR